MRPRFTLRDLLWLTLVVALSFGWWVDRTELAQDNWEMHAFLNSLTADDWMKIGRSRFGKLPP